MLLFRKLVKGSKVVLAFAYSLSVLALTRPKTRADRAAWLSRLCRRVLHAADVTFSTVGPVPTQGAVISNHLTYLDVLLHAALRPCVFVAAIEIRRLPLLGWMSMMAGTVYVVRGAGGSAANAAGGMAEGFHDGLPVVFFPEGGTGIGDVPLLPLHSGLLANALKEQAPIVASFIRYSLSRGDLAAGRSVRNDIAWGKQTLPAHLWNLCGVGLVTAEITFAAAPIPFSSKACAERKVAAEEARTALMALTGSNSKIFHSLLK